MKLGGVGDEAVGADRVAADRARARDAVRRLPAPRRRHVHVPRPSRAPSSRGACRRSAGHWYVVGFDRDRERDPRVPRRPHRRRRRGRRRRRVRRARPTSGPTTTSRTGRGCSATTPPVTVRLARRRRARATACSARSAPTPRSTTDADDGTVDVELAVTNRAAFRSVRARLPRARRGPRTARGPRRHRRLARTARGAGTGMSPRPVAGAEIQRILALVPWIVAHPGATKAEIAQRFGITVDQLDDDLALVLMIGVPPYSPGDYLDVDRGRRRRRDDPARRLLPPAAAAHAGRRSRAARRRARAARGARLAIPTGPLATALAKLEARARPPRPRRRRRRARRTSTRCATRPPTTNGVEIDYWSAGRDELTTRRIDPGRRVLRARRVVRRRVLPPRRRRAHVPRRPHPRLRADRRALRAGADRLRVGRGLPPARRRPAGHARLAPDRGLGRRRRIRPSR